MKKSHPLLAALWLSANLGVLAGPIEEARELADKKQFAEALGKLEAALQGAATEKPSLAAELAAMQARAGLLISAQQTVERTLRENPAHADRIKLMLLNARLLECAGNLPDAVSLYRVIAETTPAAPERADALADCIRAAGAMNNPALLEQCLADFTESYSSDPRSREFLHQLYRMRAAAKNFRGAAETALTFKSLYPGDPAASSMYAFPMLQQAGDFLAAVQAFQNESALPTYVASVERAQSAIESMRRLKEMHELIAPLADEFATSTGDPQLQVFALEILPELSAELVPAAIERGRKLVSTLRSTQWNVRLRMALAAALLRNKEYAAAEKEVEAVLIADPANTSAWDLHFSVVNADKRPEAHERLLEKTLASTGTIKNQSQQFTARSLITARLAAAAIRSQDRDKSLGRVVAFLETDGLSLHADALIKTAADAVFGGVAPAAKSREDAETALQSSKSAFNKAADAAQKKDATPSEKESALKAQATATAELEAAQTKAAQAQTQLDAAKARSAAALEKLAPALEKFLNRSPASAALIPNFEAHFKPYVTSSTRGSSPEAKRIAQALQQGMRSDIPGLAVFYTDRAAGSVPRYSKNADVLLARVLEKGGLQAYETGSHLVSALAAASLSEKTMEAAKQYLAKFPAATHILPVLASSARDLGAPKNRNAVGLILATLSNAGDNPWPSNIALSVHTDAVSIAEQNRMPAEMEAHAKALETFFPGLTSLPDLHRRIGVAHAATGDAPAARRHLTNALDKARKIHAEAPTLLSMASSLPDGHDWILPLMESYLSQPKRGPLQTAVLLQKAQLLHSSGKEDDALALLPRIIERRTDLLYRPFPIPTPFLEKILKEVTARDLEQTSEKDVETLAAAIELGATPAHLPALLTRQTALQQSMEAARTITRLVQSAGASESSTALSFVALAQKLDAMGHPEVAGLLLRQTINRFTGIDAKLRAQASQALFSLSSKRKFAAVEIDEKLEWAPLLKSAVSLRTGDPAAAWKTLEANEALLAKHEDKLPADYLRWVSDRLLQREDEASRTTAEKILRRWIIANESSKSVPDDEKARTQLQLADLYFKTLRYDLSRAESTSLMERFPNSPEAIDAQFRIGECFLNQKMYIEAGKVFEKMAKSRDKMTASRGEFLLGALAQQRGDIEDAKVRFRNVMDLAPRSDVADAILFRLSELYGQENRFRDELLLLRSIGLIGSSTKQWHSPGLPLNVVIQDADLGVSRGQSHVPVVVTTSSGDRELVRLESGSAGKGFFQAELPTELGSAKAGDGILQVNGSDAVTYDYPEEFKKQFTSAVPSKANIRIAADGEFRMSATEIKDEEEIPFEERLRQQRMRTNRQAGMEYRQEFRSALDIKPGNPIYLQVRDLDRDVSDGKDTVRVLVTASSGSSVSATLTETGEHTGLFRGTLPTVEIPAEVFASDRTLNGEAVRAIDSNPRTAWEGRNDGRGPKFLVLDLGEKTKLGSLHWQNDPALRDKVPLEYAIQTSDDLVEWRSVAATKKFSAPSAELEQRIETQTEGNSVRASANLAGSEARYVRILIEKFSGSAPRITEVRIENPAGGTLVPKHSAPDSASAASADGLRLTPSDRITATYEDDVSLLSIGKSRALSQQLRASYHNAKIDFVAYEFSAVNGQNVPDRLIKQVRRVTPGQRFVVRITDYDADATEERDKVSFRIKTLDGTMEKTLEAVETEPFSGVFTKEIDAWSESQPEGVRLAPGVLLEAAYEDRQNTDPGAPVSRVAAVEAAAPAEPRLGIVASTASYDKAGREQFVFTSSLGEDAPRVKTVAIRPPLTVEIIHPTMAKDSFSEITVQLTTSGGASVDVVCPLAEIPGRKGQAPSGGDSALDAGRFIGQIFMQLGDKDSPGTLVLEPGDTRSLVARRNPANRQEQALANVVPVLNLNGQDIITATYTVDGRTYTDQARLQVPASVEFTDSGYDKPVDALYIGDKIFLAVRDLTADATAERDAIEVTLTSERGERFSTRLLETLGHSGEFTGSVQLVPGEKPSGGDDRLEAWFGDALNLAYVPKTEGAVPIEKSIRVVKGTDGNLLAFEKKFASEKVAIESQFRMAEAHFELFKNYRAVKQDNLSNQALQDGMQILKELRRDFPSKQYEARTDYLLGQFSQELKKFDEAVGFYKRIVQNHPESPLAPDAQYKLGQCHEERNDMEAASAEYVSLAYTWPDSPLVANVIVRIAEYFYTRKEFPTAAEVAKKFVERFPQHDWAERMLFRAAQCWFKAEQFAKAGADFDLLVENYPRSTFRPDALFWAGESYRSGKQLEIAYRRYKRTTWDYPESEAAKYSRGKLITQEMVNIADRDAQPK